MAEIRVQIPDNVLEPLKERLGLKKNTDVIEEALTVLNWAAEEVGKGRQIYSANTDGRDVTRLATPALTYRSNAATLARR
ncbi:MULTISPECIES: hypothetical protein [unclassified Rhizobacter]|uniref:hypothetical protein n=1 Tax=unclassified Rhizobacter TaxID=2640088 RepID=UPI000B0D8B71|nr:MULTISPECIES: hypothetical protein [unclassified Rhizobacter]